jgi:hypothetical protein
VQKNLEDYLETKRTAFPRCPPGPMHVLPAGLGIPSLSIWKTVTGTSCVCCHLVGHDVVSQAPHLVLPTFPLKLPMHGHA